MVEVRFMAALARLDVLGPLDLWMVANVVLVLVHLSVLAVLVLLLQVDRLSSSD
jgi:hypothetical protein